MIERTFLHLPGIGPTREQALWRNQILSWDRLEEALLSGLAPREILASDGGQRSLFAAPSVSAPNGDLAEGHPSFGDGRIGHWLKHLSESRQALQSKNYNYFLERLDASEHWRLLTGVIDEALYLDIETTGLSIEFNYITVIGAKYKRKFYQWVWPEPLDDLAELLDQAPLVVTFNGRRFDVPFLLAWTSDMPAPKAHVDLLYLARAIGIEGGQKATEETLGLVREEEVRGVDGAQAVVLWCKALWGDRKSYKQLLLYNKYDVEMLPRLASLICKGLAELKYGEPAITPSLPARSQCGHKPSGFERLRGAWDERRSGLHLLSPRLHRRFGNVPVVVGIDLRGNPKNPTGWARCAGREVDAHVLYSDEEILGRTVAAKPDLVSIDAPLSLPRGRISVSDDSPCRATGGIVRDAERILWSRGIPVYPSLIRHMQGLTQRGIDLARKLQAAGISVIESYPGAAQDILGIPRKGVDIGILRRGLSEFGFATAEHWTHDQLDAVTSALVGYFYLADEYEGIGADDEGYMIIPRWTETMRWSNGPLTTQVGRRAVCLLGPPGSGKSALSQALSARLGWEFLDFKSLTLRDIRDGQVRAEEAPQSDFSTPRAAAARLAAHVNRLQNASGFVIGGFPLCTEHIAVMSELFRSWSLICLETRADPQDGRSSPESSVIAAEKCAREVIQNSLQRNGEQHTTGVEAPEGVDVVYLDASGSVNQLENQVVWRLMSTRLDNSLSGV